MNSKVPGTIRKEGGRFIGKIKRGNKKKETKRWKLKGENESKEVKRGNRKYHQVEK